MRNIGPLAVVALLLALASSAAAQENFNAGVGFGLTPATDGVILKLILGYRFDFASGGR